MGKLLKYELRKTGFSKLIMLIITMLAQAVFMVGISSHKEGTVLTGALLLFFIALGGILVMGLQSMLTLHRDMNTKQGYMLFMTPHSSYSILGAKAIECTVSVLLAGVFYFVLGIIDIRMLFKGFGSLEDFREAMDFLTNMFFGVTLFDRSLLTAFIFNMITAWISTIMLACFADIVISALLNGRKYTILLGIALFVVLSVSINRLINLVPASIGEISQETLDTMNYNPYSFDLSQLSVDVDLSGFIRGTVIRGCLHLLCAAGLYAASAWIMEKYLSV
ncbi:MAG: hypothetical protein IKR85_00185 [Clostridia bacterium]|nr:hypothetical protein [Clostridia bacterium]